MSRHNQSQALTKAELLAFHEQLFRCPVCSSPMRVNRLSSLDCGSGHCFDIAKQGNVHLLSRPSKSKYDKSLFASRSIVSSSGFFEPMTERVSELIRGADARLNMGPKMPVILDAGCGEGSHLRSILSKLKEKTDELHCVGVGIDIAKEGIVMAAKASPDQIWCVADLASTPFADHRFDAIVNILSPSNYAEFGRLLKQDGLLIKVIPGSSYLQELRELLYGRKSREQDSSAHTIELFGRRFDLIGTEEILYRKKLDSEQSRHLVHMTPLSWGASPEWKSAANLPDELEVTVDLTLLYGKPKPMA